MTTNAPKPKKMNGQGRKSPSARCPACSAELVCYTSRRRGQFQVQFLRCPGGCNRRDKRVIPATEAKRRNA